MNVGPGGAPVGLRQERALDAAGKAGRASDAAPESGDVEKFQAAMHRGDTENAAALIQTGRAGQVGAAQPPAAPGAPLSMGDRILRGMSAVGDKIQAGRAEAAGVLGKENVTQADLMRANFSMLESSTLVSAVSKTTEKITQGIKTLQQG